MNPESVLKRRIAIPVGTGKKKRNMLIAPDMGQIEELDEDEEESKLQFNHEDALEEDHTASVKSDRRVDIFRAHLE